MAYTIENLIDKHGEPKTVHKADKVINALTAMLESDFSQLPVVDENDRPIGIISSDSILRALSEFSSKLEDLLVSHAMTQEVFSFKPDDYLSTVQSRLLESYAALVVDDSKKLIGIVTNYDTASYYRRRAKDMMLVEEIETALREHVQVAFDYDSIAIGAGIQRARKYNNKAFYQTYQVVVSNYLANTGQNINVDNVALEKAIAAIPEPPARPIEVNELTLHELIGLLLDGGKWQTYSPTFGNISQKSMRNVLERVRKIRNMLAHFKEELSVSDQNFLQWCSNFLSRHNPPQQTTPSEVVVVDSNLSTEVSQLVIMEPDGSYKSGLPLVDSTPSNTPNDVIESNKGKYGALAVYLRERPPQDTSISLSFSDIERILNASLPNSARDTRAWWANDSVGHVQSKQWLDADWRVSSLNLGEERVTFSRMIERERAYIRFYSHVESELRQIHAFETLGQSPNGSNWHTVAAITDAFGRQCAWFNFSFLRGGRYGAMLYIDAQQKEWNKTAFDRLKIEKSLTLAEICRFEGFPDNSWLPLWDRMDSSRASRIIVYTDGSIQNDAKTLENLRTMGASVMVRLFKALNDRVKELARQS